MHIRKGHAVRLNVNLHVFIRHCGAQCLNFDFHYQLFIKPSRVPNICTDMRCKRAFLAVQVGSLSNSDSASIGAPPQAEKVQIDSDLEIEIIENYVPPPRRALLAKRKIKAEPPTFQLPAKCLHKLPPAISFNDPIDVDLLSDSSAVTGTSTAPLCTPSTLSEWDNISPESDSGYPPHGPRATRLTKSLMVFVGWTRRK